MIYPKFIKKGDTIGITAPSDGIVDSDKILKLENAEKNFEKMGFKCIETENVRKSDKGRSSSGEERAKQFMSLWEDKNVTAIIAATGGDYIIDVIENLDFEKIKEFEPKWIQGFSDITGLTFLFTTILDIATIYGSNIKSFGMRNLYKDLQDNVDLITGNKNIFYSYEKHETLSSINSESEDIYAQYNMPEKTIWKNLKSEDKISFSGRSIGGCFDVIINFIGTKYDFVKEYISKYKDDGIIWFLEVFEMNTPSIYLRLKQMKNAGYFENCKGIIFGRPLMIREDYNITFEETVNDALKDLDIPIILDADFGHLSPQMPIVTGAILDIECENGKGKITTHFK